MPNLVGSSSEPPKDSDSDADFDDDASDWASIPDVSTKSLFDDSLHPSPEEALAHDKARWAYDLEAEVERLNLDVYGRMRLIGIARKVRPGDEVQLNGREHRRAK